MVKVTLLVLGVLALYQITAAAHCKNKVDVVFILDRSGSINRPDHKRALQFIQKVVGRFDIGLVKTRVGLVAYSTRSSIQFDLDDKTNKLSLLRAIGRVRYTGGMTNTPAALEQARILLSPSSKRGARKDSRIPKVAILLTDGKSNRGNLKWAVSRLRKTKIQVYAVGIGKRISINQLKFIATDPDATHVFHIRNYSKLAAFVNRLGQTICNTGPVCSRPAKKGPCKGRFIRYYYNKRQKRCNRFIYGGCGGNGNNFKTIRACMKRCAPKSPPPNRVCSQPAKGGSCKARFLRYYYNKRQGRCNKFYYSGCGGNSNNFKTIRACLKQCGPICRKKIDVAFILDRSGSVGLPNHRRALKFIQNVVASFRISPSTTHVGLVAYSTSSSIQFDLDDKTNKLSLLRAIGRVPYTGGMTNTPAALNQAIYILNPSTRRGARRDSRIPKVAILMTDGKSNRGNLRLAVSRLRKTKIQVYVIGIGKSISIRQLKFIATDPDSTHVFYIGSYSKLAALVNRLRYTICKHRLSYTSETEGSLDADQVKEEGQREDTRKEDPSEERAEDNLNEEAEEQDLGKEINEDDVTEDSEEHDVDEEMNEDSVNEDSEEQDLGEEMNEDSVNEDSEEQDLGEEMNEDGVKEDSEKHDDGSKMGEDDVNVSKEQDLGEEGVDEESAEEGLGEKVEKDENADESVEGDLSEKIAEEGQNEQTGEEETPEEIAGDKEN